MGLPSAEALDAAPLSVVVFGPGFGESLVLRARTESEPVWAVIDSARRERRRTSVNPALDLLAARGARPSLVVLTHSHEDHTSGMAGIIETAAPGATIACVAPLLSSPSPYAPPEDPDDVAAIARSQTALAHIAIRRAWSAGYPAWNLLHDSTYEFGGWTVTVLHPDADSVNDALARYARGAHVNLNDLSAVLLIERDDVALVLGADAEQKAWTAVAQRLAPGDLTHTRPLKVSHHGSLAAVQPVIIDHTTQDPDRPQVVTPFPKSGLLPRFEPGQGVELLLAASGAVELTAMPVDLIATGADVPITTVRDAMSANAFDGDPELLIRPQRPAALSTLTGARRDPHETWVMLGVGVDGRSTVWRGAHAVRVVR